MKLQTILKLDSDNYLKWQAYAFLGKTDNPLHTVISQFSEHRDIGITTTQIQQLIEHYKENIPQWLKEENSSGETPTHYAARLEFREIVELLTCQAGADPTLQDRNGLTVGEIFAFNHFAKTNSVSAEIPLKGNPNDKELYAFLQRNKATKPASALLALMPEIPLFNYEEIKIIFFANNLDGQFFISNLASFFTLSDRLVGFRLRNLTKNISLYKKLACCLLFPDQSFPETAREKIHEIRTKMDSDRVEAIKILNESLQAQIRYRRRISNINMLLNLFKNNMKISVKPTNDSPETDLDDVTLNEVVANLFKEAGLPTHQLDELRGRAGYYKSTKKAELEKEKDLCLKMLEEFTNEIKWLINFVNVLTYLRKFDTLKPYFTTLINQIREYCDNEDIILQYGIALSCLSSNVDDQTAQQTFVKSLTELSAHATQAASVDKWQAQIKANNAALEENTKKETPAKKDKTKPSSLLEEYGEDDDYDDMMYPSDNDSDTEMSDVEGSDTEMSNANSSDMEFDAENAEHSNPKSTLSHPCSSSTSSSFFNKPQSSSSSNPDDDTNQKENLPTKKI